MHTYHVKSVKWMEMYVGITQPHIIYCIALILRMCVLLT